MFIDTHCHLTDRYNDGADDIILRANSAGVGGMVCATAQPGDIAAALNIAHTDRKSTRLNSSHTCTSRMPSSA